MMKQTARILVAIAVLLGGALGAPHGASADPLPRRGLLGALLEDAGTGVRITSVVPGSAADRARLRAGDVVRTIDGRAPGSATDVVQLVRQHAAGARIDVAIERDGRAMDVGVALGTPANENDPAVRTLYESVVVDGTLRRTLVDVPANGAGRRPAVLLIGGIGCFSVDVATDPNDGYLRITRDLAKAGFVSMRLEKSGVGDSRGEPCRDVDFAHESDGYAVALNALRHDPHVDPRRVYLLGHSIGTLIAPRLALAQPVAGVIVAEAVGRDWFEYELANLRRQLDASATPPADVDAILASKERCMHRLLIAREPEAAIERDEPACKTRNGVYPVAPPYMQQVAALNVIEPWTRVAVPVLVVYGTSDAVVAADDHARITAVVNAAHPGLATLRVIDGMDHDLRLSPSQAAFLSASPAERAREPYATAFSDALIGWLNARSR